MALLKVSNWITEAVLLRLSDESTGFNVGIATNAPNYGLDTFIQLDFTGSDYSFYQGQIDPEALESTGFIKYPCGMLYVLESVNTNTTKFSQFAGVVRCVFEVTLTWNGIRGQVQFEAYSQCVEDVVMDVINRLENQDWNKRPASSPISYNGQIQCKRGPVIYGGGNFKQKLGFSMFFQIDQ